MTKQEEARYVKKFVRYLEKEYGKKICTYRNKKDYHPDCVSCQAQWALGWIRGHLRLVEWEVKEKKKGL